MSRRKLSQQQARRVAERRRGRQRALPDDANLGPAREGLVVAHYGTQVAVADPQALTTAPHPEGEDPAAGQRCHLRANLEVVTGDNVLWRPGPELGVVESRAERRNEIARGDGFGRLRVIAANIDQLVIVIAPEPEPHANLIDRYLVLAETLGVRALLVLNKVDLASSAALAPLVDHYPALGYSLCRVSSHSGTGLEQLASALAGQTSIVVGQSGVGKSSLINALHPQAATRVGALSQGAVKGTHTTTHAQLYALPGDGRLIDSPGIREFGLWHLSRDAVLWGFPELRSALGECRFRDCRHQGEPGCAVAAAVAAGRISDERWASCQLILADAAD